MIDQLLKQSKEIYDEAMLKFKPYAVVAMVSGGDDSLCLFEVIKELGIPIDYVIHGVTGTRIKETTDFVRELVLNSGDRYLEANAGDAYMNYVLRKGFFGKGNDAHAISYHVLKAQPFRTAVSHNIRQNKPGRFVLFLNGVRVDESENRADKLGDKIFNLDPAMLKNVWVNLLHWWPTKYRDIYLQANPIKRSPVAILLGKSGECWCGTTQSLGAATEAAEYFPVWGKWWYNARREVLKRFPWDWGSNIHKGHHMEMNGQGNMFKEEPFMPMCVGCKSKTKYKKI